jgi:branched-subunit amino acid permease
VVPRLIKTRRVLYKIAEVSTKRELIGESPYRFQKARIRLRILMIACKMVPQVTMKKEIHIFLQHAILRLPLTQKRLKWLE